MQLQGSHCPSREKGSTLASATQRRILGVFAHPDDAEIWAGGTLLAHGLAGDRTAICVLTHGDGPRAQEAAQGAETLGAVLHQLAFADRGLALAQGAIEAVAEVMRMEQPNIILTHWAHDCHPDHRATWNIASAAMMVGEVENAVQAVFWCDTYNSLGLADQFQPDCHVDVSATWERKVAAIMKHESQTPAHYCEMIRRQCAMHGARSGVAYAEGFMQVRIAGRGPRARATLWERL
jgi:N-acetylglucosamine malate deacetylase 1